MLSPVACLQKVVGLDDSLVRPVREVFVHANGVEVPDRRSRHDIDAKGTVDAEVQRCVGLFHEAGLLVAILDAKVQGNGPDESLHAEFAGETQDDDVEADKGKVPAAFSIVCRRIGVFAYVGRDERVVACKRV